MVVPMGLQKLVSANGFRCPPTYPDDYNFESIPPKLGKGPNPRAEGVLPTLMAAIEKTVGPMVVFTRFGVHGPARGTWGHRALVVWSNTFPGRMRVGWRQYNGPTPYLESKEEEAYDAKYKAMLNDIKIARRTATPEETAVMQATLKEYQQHWPKESVEKRPREPWRDTADLSGHRFGETSPPSTYIGRGGVAWTGDGILTITNTSGDEIFRLTRFTPDGVLDRLITGMHNDFNYGLVISAWSKELEPKRHRLCDVCCC